MLWYLQFRYLTLCKLKSCGWNFALVRLPIHDYAANLGESVCQGLRFWFAFTGCDTVSSFAGRGKRISWTVWRSHPDANESFERYALVFHLCEMCKNIIL